MIINLILCVCLPREDSTCERSVDDVNKTLEEAKIAFCSLNPLTQILKFTINEPDYLCLELNKELQESLESGQRYN
jgi:hypothetical protein